MEARVLRLLIVDDVEFWRYVMRALFADREDVLITEARNGDEAIARVMAEDYDLVLLDLRMPVGAEGLEALVQIKAIRPMIEVIVVSAYGDTPQIVEAIKRGALDFLDKDENFVSFR
jgi:DNA-binding NtrC family response regulator